ncbi:hypothetical protein FWF89_03330 [Candidatus Saccharibacteria bacterium]|nr:hypothetical protein [Candidatus Saccharibacteria bacterium]
MAKPQTTALHVAMVNDAHLFSAAHQVAEIILSYATQDPFDTSRPLMRGVHHNTPRGSLGISGLSLWLLEGEPISIETPWGTWSCFETSDRDIDHCRWCAILPILENRLGLEYMFFDNIGGKTCGVLAQAEITHIDGVPLPAYDEADQYFSEDIYGQIISTWNQFEKARKEK